MFCNKHLKSLFIFKADIDLAVQAAKKAFHRYSEWRTLDASQRGRLLLKLADLMDRDAKYLSELETLDNGKPVAQAYGEIVWAAGIVRYYAGKADKILGSTIPAGEFFPYFTVPILRLNGTIWVFNYFFTFQMVMFCPSLLRSQLEFVGQFCHGTTQFRCSFGRLLLL